MGPTTARVLHELWPHRGEVIALLVGWRVVTNIGPTLVQIVLSQRQGVGQVWSKVEAEGEVDFGEFYVTIGGVPGRVRYDNLKPAVVRVLHGRDRAESERFTLLRSYYGFDSFFRRPGSDGTHEKGGVEGEDRPLPPPPPRPCPEGRLAGRAQRAVHRR
jgi:hypothetical protein